MKVVAVIPARYAPDGSLTEDAHEHHDVIEAIGRVGAHLLIHRVRIERQRVQRHERAPVLLREGAVAGRERGEALVIDKPGGLRAATVELARRSREKLGA